jgi:excisionase family DNA binding protein
LAIERLTVAQAAARLGVSQDAVRKRIKRGTIEYEQDQDGRLHVYLDPLEVYETRQDRAGDEPTERLAWAQYQEIEFLRRELETRTEEIRRRWQRIQVWGGQLNGTVRQRKLMPHARAGGNACLDAPRRHRKYRFLSGGRVPATPKPSRRLC